MWTFFTLDMLGVCTAIFRLLRQYCAPSVTLTVKAVTAYAWLTSMSIIVIVPLDVWTTLANQSVPAIGIMWDIGYWSTQALTWLLLPFFQVYSEAGDFTIKAKCWTSLKENVILYASVGAAGLLGIIILVATGRVSTGDIAGLCMALANTFSLSVGLLLLGYGLVEVPRYLWKVEPEMSLKWHAHRAGKLGEKVMRDMQELELVVTIVHANVKQMRRLDPLRHYMEEINETAERLSPVKPTEIAARNIDIDSLRAEDLEYNYDVQGMADLRRRLYGAIHDYQASREEYREVIVEALELESIMKCNSLGDYTPPSGSQSTISRYLWIYKCRLRPYVSKITSVLLALLGLAVIWTECTVSFSVNLSPFSQLVFHANVNQFLFQIVVLLPLVYICICMYFALFRITAFNYNRLVVRATTGAGLMQNGSLMCRFAAPTCWNYYYMLRLAGNSLISQKTVFEQRMGAMSVLPILGSHLNLYLPALLVVISLLTAFNMWDKIFNCCASSRLRFTTDDVEDEYTSKGRDLIRREQEATGKGWAVGDVLRAARLELEFPGYKPKPLKVKGKGLFSGLFGKKDVSENSDESHSKFGVNGIHSSAPVGHAPNRYQSSAAVEAASRWIRGAGDAPASRLGGSSSNLKATLVNNRADVSPVSSTVHESDVGGNGSGLDNIFASLGGHTFKAIMKRGGDLGEPSERSSLLGSRKG